MDRGIIAAAGLALAIALLEVIGFARGAAAWITPLLVAFILWRVYQTRSQPVVEAPSPEIVDIDHNAKSKFPTYTWKGLTFRSKTEIKIAKALDQRGVLFFPNCYARLPQSHIKREVDFLVFHAGKWGLLEVDGTHHHAPYDAERDNAFAAHGIPYIGRFSAKRCHENPDEVVSEFLVGLDKGSGS